MKDSRTWLDAKQAGKLAGFTGRHIQNLIAKGKLSATLDSGKYYIEKSEFFRVFPEAHRKDELGTTEKVEAAYERMKSENVLLRDMISMKDKEIEFLKNQIEIFNIEKNKMLEAINSHARLLEYKESAGSGNAIEKSKKKWSLFKRK